MKTSLKPTSGCQALASLSLSPVRQCVCVRSTIPTISKVIKLAKRRQRSSGSGSAFVCQFVSFAGKTGLNPVTAARWGQSNFSRQSNNSTKNNTHLAMAWAMPPMSPYESCVCLFMQILFALVVAFAGAAVCTNTNNGICQTTGQRSQDSGFSRGVVWGQ